jgi:hypothetical protein
MGALPRYRFFQQAYLVNDLESSIHDWNALFGAGPFVITRHHRCDRFVYRGGSQEADVSYAFGYLGDEMIQFVQQHDDTPSIYFHHVGVLVHDFAAERQRMIDLGYEPACELYADGVDAAYFDTRRTTGGFTELHGDPPHILSAFAGWRRAHELYEPGDPAIVER